MKDINIAFITDRMITGHGVDLVVDRLADGLAKLGYNCQVYCNYHDETFTNRKSYTIEKLHYFQPAVNPVMYERRIRRIAPYLNSKDIDLFIIQSFPFYSLIPVLKSPVLAVDHGIISVTGLPLKRRLRYRYMEFSQNVSYFKKAEALVTVSKYLLGCLPLDLRKKASFIYNGSDHYQYKDITGSEIKDFRDNLGMEEKDILLLYVGRLNLVNQPYKGLAELIGIYQEIYQKYKNVKLLAVGYGSRNDEELLKNEGLYAMSNASEKLMPLIYRSCDIYTTCSKWEGFDLPVAEAQGFGKPTVSYNIGAHPEVAINGTTGYVVDSKKEFREKLEILITRPDLREKMGAGAREYSRMFTWENSVKNYDRLIKKILDLKDSDIQAKPHIDIYKPPKSIEVSAVIVNYNASYPVLKQCMDSLSNQTYKNLEIIIFDNNSTNDALDAIKVDFPEVKVIYSKKNLGLGEGLNQAISQATSELILISNFDVVYNNDAVEMMVDQLNRLKSTYIGVAPKIKFYYQRDFLESVGLYLDNSFYTGYHGLGQLDLSQYNREEEIFGLSFVSCMIRRDAFMENRVGPIDPTFFLFYEDVDFCYRANLHGYRFKSCPQAICYHLYGYSFRDDSIAFVRKYYYQKLNLMKTLYKNAEDHNLHRIMNIEMGIQKSNLRDENLRAVARRVIRDFRKSKRYLAGKRKFIQFSRQLPDPDILKYGTEEKNFFDVVNNEPVYSITSLHHLYRRLFVLMGNEKYESYVSYLMNLEQTRFKIESKLFKNILHNKLEYEPSIVHKFIDRIQ
ncbi:MAG: glycosyltransferase [Actinobacteria bacterium]|nr:glycosyltransferase [Actinomycetota bacterium]